MVTNIASLIDSQQQGIKDLRSDSEKRKAERIFLELQAGMDVSQADASFLEDFTARDLTEKLKQGAPITKEQADFLTNFAKTKSPKAKAIQKKLESFSKDIGLRFQEGFLDKPKLTEKLIATKLKKEFPGEEIQTRIQDGNVEFSVAGGNFVPLDPRGGDPIGETVEQIGRFGEAVPAIAAGFIPGAQIAGPAAVTAIAQTGREALEGLQGLNDQRLGDRLRDIGLKTGFDAFLGKVFQGLGKAGRALERSVGGSSQIQQKAGKILEEDAARSVEKAFEGAKPERFAQELQSKIKNSLDQFQTAYKSAFKMGDSLALAELKTGKAIPLPMTEKLALFKAQNMDEVAVEGFNKNLFNDVLNSINNMRKSIGVQPLQSLDNLTSFDLQKGIEFIDKQLKFAPRGDINNKLLLGAKNLFRQGHEELGQAGSKSALNYTKGSQLLRRRDELFPNELIDKTVGKVGDFGREKTVPAKKFLNNIVSKAGYTDDEVAQIAKFTGMAGDDVLADIGGTRITVKSSPEFQERAGRDLVGYVLPRFSESRTGERIVNLPEGIVDKARKLVTIQGQDAYQRRGGQLKPDLFEDIVKSESTKMLDPTTNKFVGQEVLNARSLIKNLRNQAGELGEVGVEGTGKISNLVGDKALKQILDPIEQLKYAQEVAQNQFIKDGASSLSNVGQNTIRTSANFGVAPDVGNAISQFAGPLIRVNARAANTLGTALENVPVGAGRSLLSGFGVGKEEDPDSPVNQALKKLKEQEMIQRAALGGSSILGGN